MKKFKFDRSMLYSGRRPGIKDGIGFQQGGNIRRIHSRKSHSGSHHAFMYKSEASSSRQSTHVKLPKKKSPTASNEPIILFKTFDASYVLTNKSGKIVAKYVGGKHKSHVGDLPLSKVLKNTTNMFSSIVYCHRKLRL